MNDYTRTQPVSFDLTRHRVDVAEDPLLKQAEADPDDYGVPVHLADELPDDWLAGLACILTGVAAAIGFVFAPYWWPL